jgi:uncharacterized protein YbcI
LTPPRPDISGETPVAVSREMSRLEAEHDGRGPDETKADLNDEFLFCVMKDGLTTVERTLLSGGEQELARDVRLRLRKQLREDITGAVERITGHRVLAYESQVISIPITSSSGSCSGLASVRHRRRLREHRPRRGGGAPEGAAEACRAGERTAGAQVATASGRASSTRSVAWATARIRPPRGRRNPRWAVCWASC